MEGYSKRGSCVYYQSGKGKGANRTFSAYQKALHGRRGWVLWMDKLYLHKLVRRQKCTVSCVYLYLYIFCGQLSRVADMVIVVCGEICVVVWLPIYACCEIRMTRRVRFYTEHR